MEPLILDEINVKAIEFVDDDAGIVKKSVKPNFKALGPKHGKAVQPVAAAIRAFGAAEIRAIEREGQILVPIAGADVAIAREDVEILHEDLQGWVVAVDNELTVALDTELTEELITEGFAREFVNRVQNARKDAGFAVTDRIRIRVSAGERLLGALRSMTQYICRETLATELVEGTAADAAAWDINGEQCTASVERA
jgi:isoleucyl-tRNA synthetase